MLCAGGPFAIHARMDNVALVEGAEIGAIAAWIEARLGEALAASDGDIAITLGTRVGTVKHVTTKPALGIKRAVF